MDQKRIVCIDIETTGTEAEKHSIFQIGVVITDLDFNAVGGTNLFLKPLDLEWDKRAQEVHGITQDQAMTIGGDPNVVLERFEKWAQEVTGDQRPILASWGTYFDIAFLKKTYERLNREWVWQRKCIDLKTIAWWEMSRHGETVDGVAGTMQKIGLPFIGRQHDGFDDITNTVSMINILNNRRGSDIPKLTVEDLDGMSRGVFRVGTTDGRKWIATRGDVHDWAIYMADEYSLNSTFEYVRKYGNKVTSNNMITKLVPCTVEALNLYRL